MTDSKSTKRSLAASIGCIALCVVMLIGTTFAWFTDTATTGVSKVTSGTLGIELVDSPNDNAKSLENTTLQFVKADGADQNEAVLWEPGCTYQLQDVYVHNTGNLAAKYKIEITGIKGDAKLNKAIEWTITAGGKEADLSADRSLAAGAYETLTIKGHMRDDAGNDYQGLFIDGITITVSATQDTVEYDSKDNKYDEKAEYATPVSSVDELKAALVNGENVVLNSDANFDIANTVDEVTGDTLAIDVKGDTTIYGNGTAILKADDPVDKDGKIIAAGRVINVNDNKNPVTLTLSGVNIVGPTANNTNRGITVYGNSDVSIVMDNCTASADHYPLNIANDNEKVNVDVRNSSLTGYCAFQTSSRNTTATFENCTLTGENNYKGRTDNFAAIVINGAAKNANLTFKNCRIVTTEKFTPIERILRADSGSSGTVTFEGCTFVHNGEELTTLDQINEHIGISSDSDVKVTIK